MSSFPPTAQRPAVGAFGLSPSTAAVLFPRPRASIRGQRGRAAFHLPVGRQRGFAVAATQPLAEAYGEQAVDDGVQAGVEKSEDEEDVGEGVGDLPLQVVREEPVPQTQQIVRSPADYEAHHYEDAHFQSSHSGFGDVVLRATQMWLVGGHWTLEREREREIRY